MLKSQRVLRLNKCNSLVSPSSWENIRNPLFISFFRGANINSVTGMGRSSSGGMAATMAPFGKSRGTQIGAGAGTGADVAKIGFRSACCTWCAANTSSLHSIPLWT